MEPPLISRLKHFFGAIFQDMPILNLAIWIGEITFFTENIISSVCSTIFSEFQCFYLIIFKYIILHFRKFSIIIWFKTLPNFEIWFSFLSSLKHFEILLAKRLIFADSGRASQLSVKFFPNRLILIWELVLIMTLWIIVLQCFISVAISLSDLPASL